MSGRVSAIARYYKITSFRRMLPYCGLKAARKQPVRTSRWTDQHHRPAGIAKAEYRATLKALKTSERQRAKREIAIHLKEYDKP